MRGESLGERLIFTGFGESHGKLIGCVLEGCPAGLPMSEEEIQRELDLRRPGTSIVTTMRAEEDHVEIMSGVFNGYTTGAPICLIIKNRDADSRPYNKLFQTPRPGHADYVARVKYGGFNDYRGGGRFSGRITATFVAAGALAKKLLKETLGTEILAYTKTIEAQDAGDMTIDMIRNQRYSNEVRCPNKKVAEEMKKMIVHAKGEGDSLGGIIECQTLNVPIGLGEPVFSSLDSDLSRALYSIPAVKGVEMGSGFSASRKRGSENNDVITATDGKIVTTTNNSGGIVGGISNGMPIVLRVAFKPASSIAKPQQSINISTLEQEEIVVPGRHDPCVVPRAVPVVENVVALVLADHALRAGLIHNIMSK